MQSVSVSVIPSWDDEDFATVNPEAPEDVFFTAQETQRIISDMTVFVDKAKNLKASASGSGFVNLENSSVYDEAAIIEKLVAGYNNLSNSSVYRMGKEVFYKVSAIRKLYGEDEASDVEALSKYIFSTTVALEAGLEIKDAFSDRGIELKPINIGVPRPAYVTVDWKFPKRETQVSGDIPAPFDGTQEFDLAIYELGFVEVGINTVRIHNTMEDIIREVGNAFNGHAVTSDDDVPEEIRALFG